MRFIKTYETFNNSTCYYRSEPKFLGESFKFVPDGYYEAIDDNNEPKLIFNEYRVSKIPEVCASKYIGGCVMGGFSMNHTREYFIYEICEKPEKDISHWSNDDFEYLEEVRYRHTVIGKYIGKVKLTEYQKKLFEIFYKHLNYQYDAGVDEVFDKYWSDIENGKLDKELKKIKAI
jgi:hypothetical protein